MSTKQQTLDREEFINTVVREFSRPSLPVTRCEQIARALMRLATGSARRAYLFSSVEMSDRRTAQLEREDKAGDERAEKLVKELWAGLADKAGGPALEISGDPRGSAYKLRLPSGRSNSWAGGWFCVPQQEF